MLGVFDSGIGGLTVVKEIKKRNPSVPLVYFGDTARVPWGNKSQELVQQYAGEVCDFLVSQGVDEIVIACNTASALAGEHLRSKFQGVRFHDVITPVVERVRKSARAKSGLKVGLIGTKGTITSGEYERKIRQSASGVRVYSKACSLFVPLVEEGWLDNHITSAVAKEYIQELLDHNIHTLILGCTHYPLLKDAIYKIAGDGIEIISCAEEVAKSFEANDRITQTVSSDVFYFSDWTGRDDRLIKRILGKDVTVQIKRLD